MKLALVTGASRGIGKAIAEKLAGAGYALVLTCSNSGNELEIFCKEIMEKYEVTCKGFLADVSDFTTMADVFADAIFAENDLEVLVNNAGVSYVGLLHEMSPEEWNRVMGINSTGVFNTSKLAIPHMLKNHKGSIVNISSVWGNVGASTEVAYSASKGAVNSFTKALAKELAPSGIAVNAIACGLIDTQMNACFSADDLAAVVEEIPADRIGKPEEVADLAMKVIESPSYLTGQIITIDGGWT